MLKMLATKAWKHRYVSDFRRAAGFGLLAALMLWLSNWLPAYSHEPALAMILNVAGVMFGAGAIAQYLRRVLFPWMDLKQYALSAIQCGNVAAAIVVLGVCIVTATAINSIVALMK